MKSCPSSVSPMSKIGADVGVIEGGGGAGLARKAFPQQRFVAPLLGQELERHIAVEPGVPGPVDEPHAAAAEPFDDLVMGNRTSDHESPFSGRQRPDREPPGLLLPRA